MLICTILGTPIGATYQRDFIRQSFVLLTGILDSLENELFEVGHTSDVQQ